MTSPFDCPEMVDRTGMPINRAITIYDQPAQPVITLCPECRTIHRLAIRPN